MALFKRAKPRNLRGKFKESLWPGMGWKRTAAYYHHRMFRTGDTSHQIAAGLACGAALSFSPFLGTHILQALFVAFLIRANLIAAFVGTAFANPWTYPFFFWTAWQIGAHVCGWFSGADFHDIPPGITIGDPGAFFAYMFSHPWQFLLPLTVGGYIAAFLSGFIFYALLYYPVDWMRKKYDSRRKRRGQ